MQKAFPHLMLFQCNIIFTNYSTLVLARIAQLPAYTHSHTVHSTVLLALAIL